MCQALGFILGTHMLLISGAYSPVRETHHESQSYICVILLLSCQLNPDIARGGNMPK